MSTEIDRDQDFDTLYIAGELLYAIEWEPGGVENAKPSRIWQIKSVLSRWDNTRIRFSTEATAEEKSDLFMHTVQSGRSLSNQYNRQSSSNDWGLLYILSHAA